MTLPRNSPWIQDHICFMYLWCHIPCLFHHQNLVKVFLVLVFFFLVKVLENFTSLFQFPELFCSYNIFFPDLHFSSSFILFIIIFLICDHIISYLRFTRREKQTFEQMERFQNYLFNNQGWDPHFSKRYSFQFFAPLVQINI